MSPDGRVVSINISGEKGVAKHPVAEVAVDGRGLAGDAHRGAWHRQVSLLDLESIEQFCAGSGRAVRPGEFAENLTTTGLDLSRVAPLDRIEAGEVLLEVTQIGKACHGEGCAIFREVGRCLMPDRGVFGRVIREGRIRRGDPVRHLPRPLRILVVTLSDRAFAGEYEDLSGPEARRLIGEFLAGRRWHAEVAGLLLPDEPARLREALCGALDTGTDVIVTVGGTGVGLRDATPEVVTALCEKTIPGIMEAIRLRWSLERPEARLSRGVAGTAGRTQLYAVPGSVRAVGEYLPEILKTVEHLLYMLHGIDRH